MLNIDHRHATPSQRAKADEERRKARHNRKLQQATPGPGTYDMKLPVSKGLEYAGSSAFRRRGGLFSVAPLLDSEDPHGFIHATWSLHLFSLGVPGGIRVSVSAVDLPQADRP